MTEYADPDLETIAPLPPAPPPPAPVSLPGADVPPPQHRGRIAGLVAALVVVSLVVGFGTATIVLNARDSSSEPSVTAVPDDRALGGLIVGQRDVPSGYTVSLLDRGADLAVATLDLCNGTFPSESQRVARRQVALTDDRGFVQLSTEAVLYRAPSGGAQAFAELRSVAERCPSTPVRSPVGQRTVTTTFRSPPDGTWPRTPSVDRLAYDFTTTDATTGATSHSMAIYLRRGRALLGVYFAQPDGPQAAVAGRTTIAGIVGLFEARLAKLSDRVVGG